MGDRKNIKIDEELFDELKRDKGKHKSWPQYFREECLTDDSGDVAEATAAAKAAEANTEEIKRRIDDLRG